MPTRIIPSRRNDVPARTDRILLLRLPLLYLRLPRRVALLRVVLRIGVGRRRGLRHGARGQGPAFPTVPRSGADGRLAI